MYQVIYSTAQADCVHLLCPCHYYRYRSPLLRSIVRLICTFYVFGVAGDVDLENGKLVSTVQQSPGTGKQQEKIPVWMWFGGNAALALDWVPMVGEYHRFLEQKRGKYACICQLLFLNPPLS